MKLLSLFMFAALMTPAISSAQAGPVAPNANDWISVPRVCSLDKVRLQVVGDNMNVRNFKVQFGDGQVQDIMPELLVAVSKQASPSAPQISANGVIRFPERSQTPLVDLAGAGERCIVGFMIDGHSDQDNDKAYIVLRGSTPLLLNPRDPGSIIRDDTILGHAAMQDYNNRRFGPNHPRF